MDQLQSTSYAAVLLHAVEHGDLATLRTHLSSKIISDADSSCAEYERRDLLDGIAESMRGALENDHFWSSYEMEASVELLRHLLKAH